MICIEVFFPNFDFSSLDRDGNQHDVPMPSQIISALLSTGGAEKDPQFYSALNTLVESNPEILYSGSVGRKRIPLQFFYRILKDQDSGSSRKNSIDSSVFLEGATARGISGFASKDDSQVFNNSIFYVYDCHDDSLVDVLQHYASLVGYVGSSTSAAIMRVYQIESIDDIDAPIHLKPWSIPPKNIHDYPRVICPLPGYVDCMIDRYSSTSNNKYINSFSHEVSYFSQYRVGDSSVLTLSVHPDDKWQEKCMSFTSLTGSRIIPHLLKNGKLFAVTFVDPKDTTPENISDFSDIFGTPNPYDNDMIVYPYFKGHGVWSVEGYVGDRNALVAKAKVMSDVRDSTGVGFEHFEVNLSPNHYSPNKRSGYGCWDVEVVFDDDYKDVPGAIVIDGFWALRSSSW